MEIFHAYGIAFKKEKKRSKRGKLNAYKLCILVMTKVKSFRKCTTREEVKMTCNNRLLTARKNKKNLNNTFYLKCRLVHQKGDVRCISYTKSKQDSLFWIKFNNKKNTKRKTDEKKTPNFCKLLSYSSLFKYYFN